MIFFRKHALLSLTVFLAIASAVHGQQNTPRIGYVYPAGGKQGTTFEAVLGGQFLTGASAVHVSGGGVGVAILEHIRPATGKEINDLRIQQDDLMARKAVVRKDFKALEKFRTLKNAKIAKPAQKDAATEDEELEQLKKKYAEATWTEEDEKRLAEVRKKLASSVRRPANAAISELAVVRMTVAEDAKPGQRELRIATPTGLSKPLVFHVGRLAEFSKEASKNIAEQKSAIAKTAVAPQRGMTLPEMQVTLPAVINGQILPGAVDRFRFTASKGQRLVVSTSARELIPYIPDAVPGWFQATTAVYDAKGKELAYSDDYRFHPDPVLCFQVPADGEYIFEIKDAIYRGREDFVYRITIGELPWVTSVFPLGGRAGEQTTVTLKGWNLPVAVLTLDNRDKQSGMYPVCLPKEPWSGGVPFVVDTLPECLEKEPNTELASAQPVTTPVMINGRIDKPGDGDLFRIEGAAGSPIVAEVTARRLGSPLDSVLKLTDAAGRLLASNDDYEDKGSGLLTHHADSWLSATLPADGICYLYLGDAQHKGGPEYGYRLRISPPRPDFDLRVTPSSSIARVTRTIPLTVYALRRDGFSGEIVLALKDAPAGFSLSGARVPADGNQVRLTLMVPPGAQKEPFRLRLEGRATIDGRQITHPAVPAEDMMQAFEYRHLVPVQELRVAVAEGFAPKTAMKVLGATPVRIPAGGSSRVKISMPSRKFSDRFQLALSDPPEGIAIKKVSQSNDGMEIELESDAAKVKPGQQGNLIVTASQQRPAAAGKGKPQGKQARGPLTTLPAIPYEVVKP